MSSTENQLPAYEELVREFLPVIRAIAADYPERYREDLIQEGLIGLFSALRSYAPGDNRPFSPYAKACIRNAVCSAVRKLSVDSVQESLDDEIPSDESVEESIIEKKTAEEFFLRLREELSPLESKILSAYLRDWSYARISSELRIPVKTIDNSLSRIKAKIRKLSI